MAMNIVPSTRLLIVLLTVSKISFAQKDSISGVWKGISLCQVKNSPCHDEMAIYHAKRLTATTYQFQMNKMVDGKEVEMGPLVFTWHDTLKTLTAINKNSRGSGTWKHYIDVSVIILGDNPHGRHEISVLS